MSERWLRCARGSARLEASVGHDVRYPCLVSSPIRTCVGCRGKDAPANLVRYVLRDGVLTRDDSRAAHGRGAWLHDDDAVSAPASMRARSPTPPEQFVGWRRGAAKL